MTATAYRSVWTSAADGLKLHAREYGPTISGALPVVCLPGLARNSTDFHDLALALSADGARRVVALDYRGRGLSDHDPDASHYAIAAEADDTLQVLTALGIHEAVLVGTSRGGLIAMLLATQRPALIRGVVLNDIGPLIEVKGLVRIKSYVGRLPQPRTHDDGVEILRRLFDQQFTELSPADWRAFSEGTWREKDGQLVLSYDPALMKTLEEVDAEVPLTPMWPLFEALKPVPVLAIRGANSDLLSAETLTAMRRAHPRLEALVVEKQGHAPLLRGPAVIDPIVSFVGRANAAPR